MTRRAITAGDLRVVGAIRVAIGAGLIARPAMLGKALGAPRSLAAQTGWLASMVGARDAVLGVGLLAAADDSRDAARWLSGMAVADAADTLAFAGAVRRGYAHWLGGGFCALVAAVGVVMDCAALKALHAASSAAVDDQLEVGVPIA